MASSDSGVNFESVNGGIFATDKRDDLKAFPENTATAWPWPFFMWGVLRRFGMDGWIFLAQFVIPALAAAGILALIYPTFAAQTIMLPVAAYAVATKYASGRFTRPVMLIHPDQDKITLDEQLWWRDQERMIPDAVKRDDDGRRMAWLFPVNDKVTTIVDGKEVQSDGSALFAFDANMEPIVIAEDTATASHVAGIRTTMQAAEDLARHQIDDGQEAMRYGLLAVIIIAGLIAAFLAVGEAVEQFGTGAAAIDATATVTPQ